MIAGTKTPASTLYSAQRQDGALSLTIECSTRHWFGPFARAKYTLLEAHALSRERYRTKRQIEPFTNGHKNGGGALFDNHLRCKNKEFLLDITIVNPCASANLENAARYTGNNLADAAERKKTNLRG